MEIITWNKKYEIGIPLIDEQHKELVSHMHALHEAVINGSAQEQIAQTLTFLIDYTTFHFFSEEKLMLDINYPDTDAHMNMHKALTAHVQTLREEYRTGKDMSAMEVCVFLSDWIKEHIVSDDVKIAVYYATSR